MILFIADLYQGSHDACRYVARDLLDRWHGHAARRKLACEGRLREREPARADLAPGCVGRVDIECITVDDHAARDVNPARGELLAVEPEPRRLAAKLATRCAECGASLGERTGDLREEVDDAAPHAHDRIDHQLAGPVVGDIAAALDLF